MDVSFKRQRIKKIKYALVFFCGLLLCGCAREPRVAIQQLEYEDDRAVGVTFTTAMDVEDLRVFVGHESEISVIGLIVSEGNRHRFTPVVPFTPGQTYSLRERDTVVLASFAIPEPDDLSAAQLLAIYPQVDTVPQNLLKVYLEFAQPMQRLGNALDHITVTDQTDGVTVQPFLRLESELWNAEGTLLTLWLDPGRIKTDLIPNREQGLPLTAGHTYRLDIDPQWKSERGAALGRPYTQTWAVGQRDDRQPEFKQWLLQVVGAAGGEPLEIDFGEPMDAFLARETLQVQDGLGRVQGTYELRAQQSLLRFLPERPWQGGEIKLQIESRLEDLAGNNLQGPFDRPMVGETAKTRDTTRVYTLRLRLKE